VIDVSGKKIEISCASGDITVSAPSGKLAIDASQVEIKAKSTMLLDAGTTMTIKGGQLVQIN
jgi:hypothetical protein